jgi:hypothetical protein
MEFSETRLAFSGIPLLFRHDLQFGSDIKVGEDILPTDETSEEELLIKWLFKHSR